MRNRLNIPIMLLIPFTVLFISGASFAEEPLTLPNVSLTMGGAGGPQGVATAIQIILLLTILTVAPAILLMAFSLMLYWFITTKLFLSVSAIQTIIF